MTTSLFVPPATTHPRPISPAEQHRLRQDIDRCLLATPNAGDQKVIDRKKDIRKGFNRVGDTLSHFMVHAFKEGRRIDLELVNAIGHFFEARTQKIQRKLCDLFAIETKEEGDVNVAEMAIAQGDLSRPALIKLLTELDEYIPVIMELRAAVIGELQKVENLGR